MMLSEFLLARIAEDEAAARPAVELQQHSFPTSQFTVEYEWACLTISHIGGNTGSAFMPGALSPSRVLAECETKRRIIELHDEAAGLCAECGEHLESRHSDDAGEFEPTPWPCPTLRTLALPYIDHADYRREWRP